MLAARGSAPARLGPIGALLAASALVAAAGLGCDDARAPRREQPADSPNALDVQRGQPAQPAQPGSADNARDGADRRLAALREQAHITLSEYCGHCHTRSQPTAVPGALAVFDLDEPAWYAAFNRQKFPGATRRIDGEASDDERRAFAAWVEAELSLLPATR